MASTFKATFTGMEDVQRKLTALTAAASADHFEAALRAAAVPVVASAVSKAHGAKFADNIAVLNVIVEKKGKVTAQVGVRWGSKGSPEALWVETGTGPRFRKGGKMLTMAGGYKRWRRATNEHAPTGSMPARPYLRPALDENREAAVSAFGESIKAALEAVANG